MAKPGRPSPGLDEYLNWQERLENCVASDLSIDDFCEAEGVSRSTFYRWARRLTDGIPESLKEEDSNVTMAELAEPKFLPISVTASPVEIQLPNGSLVRLPVGVAQAVILSVVDAVSKLRPRGAQS
jgi:hypothetical protein